MDKETIAKIKQCKALQGKTVFDIIQMPEFRNNLAAYWQAQKQDRAEIRKSYDAMRKLGGAKGYKLPAHPIDDLAQLSADEMVVEYARVVGRVCQRPAAERRYIEQLGQQAYALTTAQVVIAEFPELENVLIPKNKQN